MDCALSLRHLTSSIHATLAALVFATGAANAEGTARIQQSDGSIKVYRDVRLVLTRWTLWVRTADRQGVLEVVSQACSFENQIQRCLPFKLTLHQAGKRLPIALEYGTVYMNFSDAVHRLPHVADRLGPGEALVLLRTRRGTYVSVAGRLDGVT
jgi:hypothetical protein